MSTEEDLTMTPNMKRDNFFNIFDKQDDIIESPHCKRAHCDCFLKKYDNHNYYHSPNSLALFIESYNKKVIQIEKVVYEEKENKEIISNNVIVDKIINETESNKVFESPLTMLSKRERFSSISSIKKNILFSPISKKSLDYDDSTIFSSQKKKSKRLKKTSNQIQILKQLYIENNSDWNKDQIVEASKRSKLSQPVIYKWLWDQKNKNIKK